MTLLLYQNTVPLVMILVVRPPTQDAVHLPNNI